jgi:hypothetical protein
MPRGRRQAMPHIPIQSMLMMSKVWGVRKLLIQLNRHKQRPTGRKCAKEQLKNKEGDDGSYKNVVQELLVEKKEKRKMKELRWQEAKTMHERRISVDEKRLMWEQEQKIMFCDVNTLDGDQKNYVLTMRAQITAMKMAEFSQSLGGSSGGSHTAGDDGLSGDASI